MKWNGQTRISLPRPGNIILVGLPGAGKTAIARDLARDLGFGYLDLDERIEHLEKKK